MGTGAAGSRPSRARRHLPRDQPLVLRVIRPNFANYGPPSLSALLLADAAYFCDLCSRVDTSLHRLVPGMAALTLLHVVCILLFLPCTAAYVLCVASLYRTGGDLLAADRVLKEDFPVVPLMRLACTFILFFAFFGSLAVAAEVEDEIMPPLWLLGLAISSYAAAVCHLACVVSVVEDAALFGAVRRSQELLSRKSWAAACVFVTLDGCIIAVLMAFQALVVEDALFFGLAFQVAAGAAMFLSLCALLLAVLVAQPVVYMVCKSKHQEVVDKAHID